MKAGTLFAVGAGILVIAGLVFAFAFIGSPGHERAIVLDRQRVSDLGSIANALQKRYGDNAAPLPKSLPAADERFDPTSKESYEFRRLSSEKYVLCANFSAPSPEASGSDDNDIYSLHGWRHGAGRTCFTLDEHENTPG